MENGYDPIVTDSYGSGDNINNFFYRPTGYGNHAIQFTETSGVDGYTLVDIGEGSMMLYGLDSDGTPWIGLRSCSIVPEEVHLPEFTIELLSYAMAGTQSASARYTIDFENMWILWAFDEGCFRDSMISGDIVLASDSYVDDNAFNGCPCITSVTLPGEQIFLGATVFQNCTSLKSATIGGLAGNSTLEPGLFANSNALTDITFTSWNPNALMIYLKSVYQFNTMWTLEEEEEKLRIHVPEGQELTYVKAWRYGSIGYGSDPYSDSPYIEMWNDIQFSNIDWDNWEFPENSVVDVLTKQRLLEAENHLRKLFGMELVTEPTDYYPYRVNDGMVTMVGAPSYLEYLNMDYADFDLPDGWYFDYIGTGALADCENLQYVKVADNLTGIYSNAFGKVKDSLTLEFTSPSPIKLMTDVQGETFYFGPDEDKMHIVVPEGWEEIYLNMWKYQMAGYEDYDAMHDAIYFDMIDWDNIDWDTVDWDELMQPSEEQEEEIQAEMQRLLEPAVARLQKLLGMSSEDTETDLEETGEAGNAETDAEGTEESGNVEIDAEGTEESGNAETDTGETSSDVEADTDNQESDVTEESDTSGSESDTETGDSISTQDAKLGTSAETVCANIYGEYSPEFPTAVPKPVDRSGGTTYQANQDMAVRPIKYQSTRTDA